MRHLVPLGALPMTDALGVLFSIRDLRAFSLLDRLEKSKNAGEEKALLNELQETPSRFASRGLLSKLKSPQFSVRVEALNAISALKTLDDDTESALMRDIVTNPYTTAYLSAKILGVRRISEMLPLFRELLESDDYMLAGEAMLALSRYPDWPSRSVIEDITARTKNPRLKITGIASLGNFASVQSLPALFDIFLEDSNLPHIRDEAALAMASILDIPDRYYKLLTRFQDASVDAATLAADECEAAWEFYRSTVPRNRNKTEKWARALQPAVEAYMKENNGKDFSRWLMELPSDEPAEKGHGKRHKPEASTEYAYESAVLILSEAVLLPEPASHDMMKLLFVQWACVQLRHVAKAAKN
jgi:hypothetical protein